MTGGALEFVLPVGEIAGSVRARSAFCPKFTEARLFVRDGVSVRVEQQHLDERVRTAQIPIVSAQAALPGVDLDRPPEFGGLLHGREDRDRVGALPVAAHQNDAPGRPA